MDPVRIGLVIRAIRRRKGWTQARLADAGGVSRSLVQPVERGGSDEVTGGSLRRVTVALGVRLDVRVLWHGEALDRLLDEDHARLVETVIRWLRAEGWEVLPEATFAIRGEHGSIDVLAWHAASRTLLVVEVKTVVPDVQAMLATLDRKARLAATVALERGWGPVATVGRLLVLPEGSTVRRRVAQHATTFDSALPQRTVAVRRWVRRPAGPLAGIAFLPDAAVAGNRHRISAGRQSPRA